MKAIEPLPLGKRQKKKDKRKNAPRPAEAGKGAFLKANSQSK